MLLSDKTITALCVGVERPLITPFSQKSISRLTASLPGREVDKKVCSFGLSSFGYDLSLGNHFRVLKRAHEVTGARIIDPNNFDQDLYREVEVPDYGTFVLPPHGCALAVSKERLDLPRNVTGIAMQKSTIARSMMEVTVTPLEAGWQGFLTFEFHNKTDFPIHLTVGMGIAQILFVQGDQQCLVSYADRDGKYQDQPAKAVAPRQHETQAESVDPKATNTTWNISNTDLDNLLAKRSDHDLLSDGGSANVITVQDFANIINKIHQCQNFSDAGAEIVSPRLVTAADIIYLVIDFTRRGKAYSKAIVVARECHGNTVYSVPYLEQQNDPIEIFVEEAVAFANGKFHLAVGPVSWISFSFSFTPNLKVVRKRIEHPIETAFYQQPYAIPARPPQMDVDAVADMLDIPGTSAAPAAIKKPSILPHSELGEADVDLYNNPDKIEVFVASNFTNMEGEVIPELLLTREQVGSAWDSVVTYFCAWVIENRTLSNEFLMELDVTKHVAHLADRFMTHNRKDEATEEGIYQMLVQGNGSLRKLLDVSIETLVRVTEHQVNQEPLLDEEVAQPEPTPAPEPVKTEKTVNAVPRSHGCGVYTTDEFGKYHYQTPHFIYKEDEREVSQAAAVLIGHIVLRGGTQDHIRAGHIYKTENNGADGFLLETHSDKGPVKIKSKFYDTVSELSENAKREYFNYMDHWFDNVVGKMRIVFETLIKFHASDEIVKTAQDLLRQALDEYLRLEFRDKDFTDAFKSTGFSIDHEYKADKTKAATIISQGDAIQLKKEELVKIIIELLFEPDAIHTQTPYPRFAYEFLCAISAARQIVRKGRVRGFGTRVFRFCDGEGNLRIESRDDNGNISMTMLNNHFSCEQPVVCNNMMKDIFEGRTLVLTPYAVTPGQEKNGFGNPEFITAFVASATDTTSPFFNSRGFIVRKTEYEMLGVEGLKIWNKIVGYYALQEIISGKNVRFQLPPLNAAVARALPGVDEKKFDFTIEANPEQIINAIVPVVKTALGVYNV